MSFWVVVFNALLALNLPFTLWLGIAQVLRWRDCGSYCAGDDPPGALWFVGEFVIAPPLLVAIGAVFADRDRRRLRNVWIGLSALLLTLCVMLTVTLIMQFTEPPPYRG